MLNCPRCSSAARVKSGAINGRQRYKCQACRYLYTVVHKSDISTAAQRRMQWHSLSFERNIRLLPLSRNSLSGQGFSAPFRLVPFLP